VRVSPVGQWAAVHELAAELTDDFLGRVNQWLSLFRLDDGVHLANERLNLPDRSIDVLLIHMCDRGP
jgi:hypothetical protein